MQSNRIQILRWAGAIVLLLLIGMLMVEGTWAIRLHRSWLFVSVAMVAAVLLVIAGVRDIHRCAWAAAMSHIGLGCVLAGGMIGAVVKTDVKIVVDKHATERVAYTEKGEPEILPFDIRLQDFRIDYYDDGTSPKQFTSALIINGKEVHETSVNHPARYHGWWIYQSDYDRQQQDFCVLQVVRDPWLPVVYAGFALMVIGAMVMTCKAWHSWRVLVVAVVLAGLFTVAALARVELGTLVPALRSLWFFPHILIYMVAYSLLAIALVAAIANVWQTRRKRQDDRLAHLPIDRLTRCLLVSASSLLLIGMLCGAVWAKDAWGDYWMWDGKECWAAATWLITLLVSHIPTQKVSRVAVLVVIVISFVCMQMTWYGVNYLPSAQYSLHTYNK